KPRTFIGIVPLGWTETLRSFCQLRRLAAAAGGQVLHDRTGTVADVANRTVTQEPVASAAEGTPEMVHIAAVVESAGTPKRQARAERAVRVRGNHAQIAVHGHVGMPLRGHPPASVLYAGGSRDKPDGPRADEERVAEAVQDVFEPDPNLGGPIGEGTV